MIDIAGMIRKVGVPVKSSGKSRDAVAGVYCSECGGMIRSDDVDGGRIHEDKAQYRYFFFMKSAGGR